VLVPLSSLPLVVEGFELSGATAVEGRGGGEEEEEEEEEVESPFLSGGLPLLPLVLLPESVFLSDDGAEMLFSLPLPPLLLLLPLMLVPPPLSLLPLLAAVAVW
jgi:hypothetical protein